MLVVFLLACLLSGVLSHTISLCYDLRSKPGSLIIWQQHWHGSINPTPYGIVISNPSDRSIDFSKWKLTPHGARWSLSRDQLRRENPNLICNFCDPENRNFNWFNYEFPVCVFGVKGLSLTVDGDPNIVETMPASTSLCPTRITIPPSVCPDANGDGYCDNCNCVACSGTPFDSVCGNNRRDNGEECDDAADRSCQNCKCKPGYLPDVPATTVCKVANPCAVWPLTPAQATTATCTNSGSNRVINCFTGYYVSGSANLFTVTLPPGAVFTGCIDLSECNAYGFSQRGANTAGCSEPVINTRIITCNSGYVVDGTTSRSATLTGNQLFAGCVDLNECDYFKDANKPNVAGCTHPQVDQRTITCSTGYRVVGTRDQQSITISGLNSFPGCEDIPECVVYRFSNKDSSTIQSCVDTLAINSRTITCRSGYYIGGRTLDTTSAAFTGNTEFPGCLYADFCILYAFSSRPQFTASCTSAVGERTITCQDGYYVSGGVTNPPQKSVRLLGSSAFTGCIEVNECLVYGTPPNSQCQDDVNARRITCSDGFYLSGTTPTNTSIITTTRVVGNQAFSGCVDISECTLYFSIDSNTARCTENAVNQRNITCKSGYFVNGRANSARWAVFTGNDPFNGCVVQDQCTLLGFDGKPENTQLCSTPEANRRRLVCQIGYVVANTTSSEIVLGRNDIFGGCVEINECELYKNTGLMNNVEKCVDGTNQRTITCNIGFYPSGLTPADRSLTLVANAAFPGCVDIDECQTYKYSGQDTNAASCVEGTNSRTIRCDPGYYIKGRTQDINSAVFIGDASFPGCILSDFCLLYAVSARPNFVQDCKSGINTRTITCVEGYFVNTFPQTQRSVTLTGSAVFPGCSEVNECAVYPVVEGDMASCTNGVNSRVLTCNSGYYVSGKTFADVSVTLVGSAHFPGCKEIDECALYSFSDRKAYTLSCRDLLNAREITCMDGYYVGGGRSLLPSIILSGSSPFPGCFDINECTAYGSSGNNAFVSECLEDINSRTIVCAPGYYAVYPNTPVIKLTGNERFSGCNEINECSVYSFSGKFRAVKGCRDGVNRRTITCEDGYWAGPTNTTSYTLMGADPFEGCIDVPECSVYGYSGKSANTLKCVETELNTRTITCMEGYKVKGLDNYSNQVILYGRGSFSGCVSVCGDGIKTPNEQCDDRNLENGDGCSSDCTIEKGFDCGNKNNYGKRCCNDLPPEISQYQLDQPLACFDSWWVSPTDSPIILDNDEVTLNVSSSIKLCGDIRVGSSFGHREDWLKDVPLRNRHRSIQFLEHVTFAGSVTVLDTGSLWFIANVSSLTITQGCKEDSSLYQPHDLYIDGRGLVAIEDIYWTVARAEKKKDRHLINTPTAVLFVSECSVITGGSFYVHATNIPLGSNSFNVIESDCVISEDPTRTFLYQGDLVPGHCTDLFTENDDKIVTARLDHRDLCRGEMAAIGLLVVGGTAAAATAGAIAVTGGGAAGFAAV